MPIQIRCTCQQILAVDEAHQGQVVGCPYCGTQLTVPVLQQQTPAPGYGTPPPPPGFPPQAPQRYPQQFSGQQGWQNPAPPAPPSAAANNPFANLPGAAPSNNPFANLPGAQSAPSNSFGAPQAPTYPAPTGPAFPNAPGPGSNAPSMPFLAMDVPAKGRVGLNELSRGTTAGGWDESTSEAPRIWHIPCPKGHILETPDDMLDQEVLCPYCETQFTLQKFQSVEETEKRERARAIRDEKHGQLWLKWAIGIAAVVILGVIVMIAISASQ
jgi:DNA-directed RNA polymerase subunit RPC12/RpoP